MEDFSLPTKTGAFHVSQPKPVYPLPVHDISRSESIWVPLARSLKFLSELRGAGHVVRALRKLPVPVADAFGFDGFDRWMDGMGAGGYWPGQISPPQKKSESKRQLFALFGLINHFKMYVDVTSGHFVEDVVQCSEKLNKHKRGGMQVRMWSNDDLGVTYTLAPKGMRDGTRQV